MAFKLSGHQFSGANHITVFGFLTLFVKEADIQEISKAQGLLALFGFLKGFAKRQYEDGAEMAYSEESGISSQRSYLAFTVATFRRQESV